MNVKKMSDEELNRRIEELRKRFPPVKKRSSTRKLKQKQLDIASILAAMPDDASPEEIQQLIAKAKKGKL